MNTNSQKDNKKSTTQSKNNPTEKNKSTDTNKTGPSKKKIKKHFFKHKKKARKSEKQEKPEKQNKNNTKQNTKNKKQGKNKSQNRKKPPKKKTEKDKKPKEKVNNNLEVGKAVIGTEWNIESISRYIIAVKAAIEKTPERNDGKKDLLEVWINSSLPVDLIYQIIDKFPDELNIDKKIFIKDNKPLF